MLVDKIKLEPGEKILIQTRRHWFVIVSQILALGIVAVLPLLAIIFVNSILKTNASMQFDITAYKAEILFIYTLILLFVWVGMFNLWTNYFLDLLTITDRRAILTNQKGFFWRNVASFRLERLQDMNVEVNGLIATMLDYGTLEVETAGDAKEEFTAKYIPKPGHIKSIILQASDNRMNASSNHPDIDGVS